MYSQDKEGFQQTSLPNQRITVKYLSISLLVGGLLMLLTVWKDATFRNDIRPFLLGVIAGLSLGESLWQRLHQEYMKQLENHLIVLRNRAELLLKPQPILLFVIFAQVISLSLRILTFQERFIDNRRNLKFSPHNWEWGYWTNILGGFSTAMTIWVAIRLVAWAYLYRRKNGVEAEYSIPIRNDRPLSWKERVLLLTLLSPFFIVAVLFFFRNS